MDIVLTVRKGFVILGSIFIGIAIGIPIFIAMKETNSIGAYSALVASTLAGAIIGIKKRNSHFFFYVVLVILIIFLSSAAGMVDGPTQMYS